MHEKWTESEIQKLKIFYPKRSLSELMEMFPNRCDSGITNKAKRLGLKKSVK